ncbi:MAG TPA: DUF6134 family protein [Candidatus Omnitrophota bacterium]|nr:DUF6134 family protein [Candidatus Omnitrophota bacterium]
MKIAIHALAALTLLLGAAADAEPRPDHAESFTVLRNGDPVGSHTIEIRPGEAGTTVDIATNVVVKIAMIPVYRFEHRGSERWRDGRLLAMSSQTNDDGTRHSLDVRDTGNDVLDVVGDGQRNSVGGAIVPASLWNRATVAQTILLNTLDGRRMAVTVQDLGSEAVMVRGQARPARHYSLTGELQRELWYDESGLLVQVAFKGRDDSDIRYVLR